MKASSNSTNDFSTSLKLKWATTAETPAVSCLSPKNHNDKVTSWTLSTPSFEPKEPLPLEAKKLPNLSSKTTLTYPDFRPLGKIFKILNLFEVKTSRIPLYAQSKTSPIIEWIPQQSRMTENTAIWPQKLKIRSAMNSRKCLPARKKTKPFTNKKSTNSKTLATKLDRTNPKKNSTKFPKKYQCLQELPT